MGSSTDEVSKQFHAVCFQNPVHRFVVHVHVHGEAAELEDHDASRDEIDQA